MRPGRHLVDSWHQAAVSRDQILSEVAMLWSQAVKTSALFSHPVLSPPCSCPQTDMIPLRIHRFTQHVGTGTVLCLLTESKHTETTKKKTKKNAQREISPTLWYVTWIVELSSDPLVGVSSVWNVCLIRQRSSWIEYVCVYRTLGTAEGERP